MAMVTAVGLAAPASAAAGKYVALGDSYASGTGAGSYGNSGGCKRSANSYAQLWANANAPSAFSFVACSGAVTSDVLNGQVSAITSDTALVTISIGGNDAGFADVMITCNTSSDATCVSRNQQAQTFARNTLPGRLNNVYTQIRNRAPSARVVVLGYPHIYKVGGSCWVGLSDTKRAAINQSADVLASVISGRANAYGFTFVDARSAFSGHEICASGARWINSITWPVDDSYHPNAAGHRGGYYSALESVA
jgi:lysophospholipase L1-like esterase